LIKNCSISVDPGGCGADIPMTPEEKFVNGVYSLVDEAIACKLDGLRSREVIIPTCKLGCCHCCRDHILTNRLEAHTLAQYVKREFSTQQINELRMRTHQWHEWENSRPGRYPSVNIDGRTDLSHYDPCCPLLVKDACSAYKVRPVVCRTHFVSSPALACLAINDPKSAKTAPVKLTSVVNAAAPFSRVFRDHIENSGLDFSRSLMLLPHSLAIEMGWNFSFQCR